MHRTSLIFQEIQPEMVSLLFRETLGEGRIQTAKLLEGGLFNTTYYVEYGLMPERAVLRLGPVNRQLLLGCEENLMAAEAYLCAVCRSCGIPCAAVLACDTSKRLIDRDFMIMAYIPSVAMSSLALEAAAKDRLYRQMGAYLTKLHQVEGACFGYVSRICQGVRFQTWGEAFLYEAEDVLTRLEQHRVFPAEVLASLRRRFAESRAILDEIQTPHLLHTDMWEGNVLLTEDAREIAAIIDGDRAVFGDIDFEYASEWGQRLAQASGDGAAACDPKRRERIALYQLYYALLEVYAWTVEYCNPDLCREKQGNILRLIRGKEDRF